MKKYSLIEYQRMLHDADCKWCRKRIHCPDCEGYGVKDTHGSMNDNDNICDTCKGTGDIIKKVSLAKESVEHYPHNGGWNVEGFDKKQWLYITCPGCGYQWALHKLNIPIE